ncbi:hypothetical protein ACHAXS_002606 [Conticribra weissflogii]
MRHCSACPACLGRPINNHDAPGHQQLAVNPSFGALTLTTLCLLNPVLCHRTKALSTNLGRYFFANYITKFEYISLMTDQSAEASVKAKHTFEHFCGTCNVDVQHFHADNSVFGYSLFM